MNKTFCSIVIICLAVCTNVQAQWINVTPPQGNFSFKMPAQPVVVDTLQNMLFSFEVDSSLILQAYYTETDSAFGTLDPEDTLQNPLCLYIANLLLTTSGELEELNDLTPDSTNFVGKQVGVSYYTPDSVKIFLFTRFYFDGQNMLIFIVSAPESRLTELVAYKDEFFDNINLD